jgi:hypothetical protein
MPLLANILQGDRTYLDLIQLALETLANVVTYETGSDEGIVSLCNGYSFMHLFTLQNKRIYLMISPFNLQV